MDLPWDGVGGTQQEGSAGIKSLLPALAPDTALEMALLEMARFLFMISSNSTSLTGGGGGPSSRLHRRHTWGSA